MEHLSEERLLEIADGGLEDDHVRECAECARAVEEQRAARAALKAAPLLELPRERIQDYVAALPDQTRVRRLRGWPQRLAILAPVAAAAIAILVSGRGEDLPQREGAEDAEVAMSAPAQEDAGDASTQSKRAGTSTAPEATPLPAQIGSWDASFPTRPAAEGAAARLESAGFSVVVEPEECGWYLLAIRPPELDVATADAEVESATREFGGEVRSIGTTAPGTDAGPPNTTAEDRGWTVLFRDRADADASAAELRAAGFATDVTREGEEWLLTALKSLAPGEVCAAGRAIARAARTHDGRLDSEFLPGSPGS